MKMLFTFVLTLTAIVNSIQCSSPTHRNSKTQYHPGPSTSSSPSPSASEQDLIDRTSSEEPLSRARSRSPMKISSSIKILGYSLQRLGYIRLIPFTRRDLKFEFRSFAFPADQRIILRTDGTRFTPVPTQEQIVLSAPNGDVFAILEYEGFLRGFYRAAKHNPRVKINILSGKVNNLTPEEMRVCLVGKNHAIFPTSYIKDWANKNSLHFKQDPISERDTVPSSSARQNSSEQTNSQEALLPARPRSPPGRPPSDEVLGFTMDKLGFIRLIPRENHNRRFVFRRFIIPANIPIRVRWRGNNFMRVPTREHIVLSTSDGDVLALLEYTGFLRGIYMADESHSRTKINMISGKIAKMTADEMRECHVGENYPIFPKWFEGVVSKRDSLQNVYH